MDNKKIIYEDLIEGFIRYQWRLDNPMPKPGESFEEMKFHFFSDPVFRAKVKNIVSEYIQRDSLGQDEVELLKIAIGIDTKETK